MGFFSFIRNLFKRKTPIMPPQTDSSSYKVFKPFTSIDNEKVDLQKYFGDQKPHDLGYNEAGSRGGDFLGFRLHLNKIYGWYYEERRTIAQSHNEDTNNKIEELETENTKAESKINFIISGKATPGIKGANNDLGIELNSKEDTVPFKERKIKEVQEEIRDIQENPKESKYIPDYNDDKNHKLTYAISLIGMIVIITFLWIFYSSVIYSALWREFKPSKNLFLESILYPQAVEEAFGRNFITGLGICILPFVFVVLAFIFDYFVQAKKYLIGAGVLLFAFMLDSYLAYKITERIYQISHTTFSGVAEYNFKLAFQDTNFWIIIFLGFGLYIFLGIVYHAFGESLKALNKVKRAIKKRKDIILQLENDLHKLNDEVNKYRNAIEDNKRKITAYRNSLLTTIFRFDALSKITDGFVLGWTEFQERSRKYERKKQCEEFYDNWLKSIKDSLVSVTDIH